MLHIDFQTHLDIDTVPYPESRWSVCTAKVITSKAFSGLLLCKELSGSDEDLRDRGGRGDCATC